MSVLGIQPQVSGLTTGRVIKHQAAIGLSLTTGILGLWLALHLYGVFFLKWNDAAWIAVPILILVQTWLYVGMFIIAHDAIHGSLAPGRSRLNFLIGQLCVGCYAGFSFAKLKAGHVLHHQNPGTAGDPDFDAADPAGFAHWFATFFLHYFSWRELLALAIWSTVYVAVLHAPLLNLALFWMLPSLLSALQLFTFGTWLPHRHVAAMGEPRFADPHRARSNNYSWLVSLLTCFHFGYHLEHHLMPHLPWWRLPGARPKRVRAQVQLPRAC